jgi:DNA-binding IscR family transcriptional regulator
VKGGYSLARPADTISLAELLESIEDGFRLTVCSHSDQVPDNGACTLIDVCTVKGQMAEVQRRLIEVLRGVSLADLFDPDMPRMSLSALPVLSVATNGCCSAKASVGV